MFTLGTLLDDLKGVLGKAFLLAGLLPAGACIVMWNLVRNGSTEVKEYFTKLVQLNPDAAAELLAVLLPTVLLGLVFYSARSLLVVFLQELPGPPPFRWLHKVLIKRKLTARRRVLDELERHTAHLTAIDWIINRAHEVPDYVPSQLPPVKPDKAVRASENARRLLDREVAPVGPVPAAGAQSVVEGIARLYVAARSNSGDRIVKLEIAKWQKILSDSRGASVMRDIESQWERRTSQIWLRFNTYASALWMKPTWLGIKAARLDDYAEERYGIDTSTLWMRLSDSLEAAKRQAVADARLTVETLVNLSIAAALLAPALLVDNLYNHWRGFDPRTFSEATALQISLVVICAGVFYVGGVFAFSTYADRLKRLIDLYHRSLIETLGFARPKSLKEERAFFEDLQGFFTQAEAFGREWPLKDVDKADETPETTSGTLTWAWLRRQPASTLLWGLDAVDSPAKVTAEPLENLGVTATIRELNQFDKRLLLVVGPEGEPANVIPTSLIHEALLVLRLSGDADGLTLGTLLSQVPALGAYAARLWVTARPDVSAGELDVQLRVNTDCQCVVFTEDGELATKAIGITTRARIIEALTV